MRLRPVQGDPGAAVPRLDRLTADKAIGVDDIDHRRSMHVKDGRVEQRPAQHLIIAHRLGDVIHAAQSGVPIGSLAGFAKLDGPDVAQPARLVDEVKNAAADAPDRRDLHLAVANRLFEGRSAQRDGPFACRHRVLNPEPDIADRRPVHGVSRTGEPRGFLIQHDPDIALPPERDLFRHMIARVNEAHRGKQFAKRLSIRPARGELDEFNAVHSDPFGHRRKVCQNIGFASANVVHHRDQ